MYVEVPKFVPVICRDTIYFPPIHSSETILSDDEIDKIKYDKYRFLKSIKDQR